MSAWVCRHSARRLRNSLFAAFFLLQALLCVANTCHAQSGRSASSIPSTRAAIVRTPVDAAHPENWPAGDWRPIRRQDLDSAIETSAPGVRLARAEYSARLDESGILRGSLRWNIQRIAATPMMLDLSKINFAVERLTWSGSNEDVVAGTDASGRILAVVDREAGEMTAGWSTTGIAVADAYVFSLEFAPSSTSRLVIDVPAGWSLSTPESLVTPASDETGPSKTFILELGQRDRVQFVALKRAREQPVLEPLVRQYVTYSVRPESLRFDVVFELDPLGPASSSPEIVLDSGCRVLSVRVGDDVSTAWRVESAGPAQRLIPSLRPGEPAQKIVLSCLATQPIAGLVTLPRAFLSKSQTIDIRTVLRLHPSVDLRNLHLVGHRVVDQSRDDTDGGVQVLALKAVQADPQIQLTSMEPTNRLRCRSLLYVEPKDKTAEMTAVVEWSAAHGRSFETSFSLPAGWEVVNVESVTSSGPSQQLAAFDVTTTELARNVRLQFRNAVSTERPQLVLVTARMPMLQPWPQDVEIGVRATAAEQGDSECSVIVGGPLETTDIPTSGSFVPTEVSAIQSTFENAAPWRTVLDRVPAAARAATTRPNKWTAGWLRLTPASMTTDTVQVRCKRDQTQTLEELTIVTAGASAPNGRLLVFVPGDSTPWVWNDQNGPMEQDRIRACTAAEQLAESWPEDGVLWEISVDSGSPTRIHAERTRANTERFLLPTASIRPAGGFRGSLQLEATAGASVIELLDPNGSALTAEMSPSQLTATEDPLLSWRTDYNLPTSRFLVRSSNAAKRIAAVQQRSSIRVPASNESAANFVHELEFPAASAPLEVTGSLPAEALWLKADVDGRPIRVQQSSGHKWSVQLPAVPKPQTLRLFMRVTTRAWSHASEVSIPSLTLDTPSISTVVRILIPRGVQPLWGRSGRLVSATPRTWTERCFGWLGRAPETLAPAAISGNNDEPGPLEDSTAGLRTFELIPNPSVDNISLLVADAGLFQTLGAIATLLGALGACLLRIRPARSSRLVYVLGVALATGMVLLPEAFSALVASLSCGIAIGWLLPPRWSTNDESTDQLDSTGDDLTRTYAAPFALMRAVLIVVLIVSSTARAQPPETMPPDSMVVLEPQLSESTGQPSEIVYGSSSLVKWVEQERSRRSGVSDVLIRSAVYALGAPAPGSASIPIRMQLLVQRRMNGSGLLQIPLRGAHLYGEASCRVNDNVVPAELSPSGDRLSIPLSNRDLSKADSGTESETRSPPASGTAGWQSDIVTLEWITPQAGGDAAFLDFAIPRTLSTTVTAAPELLDRGFRLSPPFDRLRNVTNESPAPLSPANSLMGSTAFDSPRKSPLQGADFWSLELGVDSTILRRSIRITDSPSPSQRFVWPIPGDWQPVRVEGTVDCIFESIPLATNEDSLLLVECARSQRTGDLLEIVFRRKQRLSGPEIVLPADLFRANETYAPSSSWLAVRTGTEFRSEIIAGDSVRIRTIAEFAQRTRETSPTPGTVVELLRDDEIRVRRFLPNATLNVSNARLTLKAGASRTVAVYSATVEPSAAAIFPWQFELPPGVEVNRVLGRNDDVETTIDWRRNDSSIVVFPWERLLRPLRITLEMELETPLQSPRALPLCRLRDSTESEVAIELSADAGSVIKVTETQPEWNVVSPQSEQHPWTMTVPAGVTGPKWKWQPQDLPTVAPKPSDQIPAKPLLKQPFEPITSVVELEPQFSGWQLRGRWWWKGEPAELLEMRWKHPVQLLSATVDGRVADLPSESITAWLSPPTPGVGGHAIELVWKPFPSAGRIESTTLNVAEGEAMSPFTDDSISEWLPECKLFPRSPRLMVDRLGFGAIDWRLLGAEGSGGAANIAAQRFREAKLVSEAIPDSNTPWIAATLNRLRKSPWDDAQQASMTESASTTDLKAGSNSHRSPLIRLTGWSGDIVRAALACIVASLLVLFGRRLRGALDRSEFLAWGVLGIWWWWCLSPPIIGLALMLWSLGTAIRSLFTRHGHTQSEFVSPT